jgi:F-type H+-transporting ATPase subunit epsilon
MHLKILRPFDVFLDKRNITRIVAESAQGSFGILPRRLDCVAPLVPGILTYQAENEDEIYVAIDQGILAKTGPQVLISVRDAILGTDLSQLRQAVQREFLELDETQQRDRFVMKRMESGFLRHLETFHHE